ncbi:succinate dehydrogenase assembly factor 2, mitochondrial [Hordeum vulgare]|nr:succinate dehydrogenase assembly factor 2, mitochondrial [Hordeum vulgare]
MARMPCSDPRRRPLEEKREEHGRPRAPVLCIWPRASGTVLQLCPASSSPPPRITASTQQNTTGTGIDKSNDESRRPLVNRSKQRGFLELDLVLGTWVEHQRSDLPGCIANFDGIMGIDGLGSWGARCLVTEYSQLP